MFERFTQRARDSVKQAQQEAREMRHPGIGTEHLLVALVAGHGPAAAALLASGQTLESLRTRVTEFKARADDPLDSEALKSIGIDLDTVRAATEDTFGEGALDAPRGWAHGFRKGHRPFSPQAKKALELSLRHALRLKHKHISDGHILLGILHDSDFTAVHVLKEANVDIETLRSKVTHLLAAEAA